MQHICSLEYIRRLYEATNLDGRDTGTVRESFAQLPESNRSRRYVLNNLMACVAGTSTWCRALWIASTAFLFACWNVIFPLALSSEMVCNLVIRRLMVAISLAYGHAGIAVLLMSSLPNPLPLKPLPSFPFYSYGLDVCPTVPGSPSPGKPSPSRLPLHESNCCCKACRVLPWGRSWRVAFLRWRSPPRPRRDGSPPHRRLFRRFYRRLSPTIFYAG